jgi:uncharacterized coiled-coil protein SlyX
MNVNAPDNAAAWALLASAIAGLFYLSPSLAYKRLAASLEKRVKSLEEAVNRLEQTIRGRDQAIEERDGVIRRLRSKCEILVNLLHVHRIQIPDFENDEHPEFAPERRTPVVPDPVIIVTDPEGK